MPLSSRLAPPPALGKDAPAAPPAAPRPTPASSLDIYQGDPNFMTSLARGLIVIQAFTQQSPQMTISQLSVKTGLSRAAVRRCLYTLTKLGFAGAEDGQRYSLRPRMLSLSHTYTTSSTLSTSAQPVLERMSSTFRESFSVATLDGDDIVYIARTQVASRVMAVDLHIGSRLPAYCTSMGRVLLAYLPPDQLEQYLARVDLIPHTTRTITTVDKLRLALRSVRRLGYALVDQELEVGLRSLAVPVYAPNGRVVATVNLSGNAPRLPVFDMQTHFLTPLRNAATEIGSFLR
ncbi:IclR family transcriptional regulator domain-containing protein [Granulicella tundricola]|uniref:Transcriptional regulator, IclR family n=1 Tax=Granulicella tundricola (strain ATCC BAA-1859 / DSM 23138 / MP5ACTX9) TaxID=1198114 RepID=E8WY98_GRATM|nr:IclR family transcriptional regulator C-terminal domain-containing protein [Granulicella tundricola]ADW68725.1 transcriptional regulator, IclR family [Granulicella tundricola MP5ACTX9]